jgi:polysaccharide deacetylase family protein (PEP-CTERM system associated)
MRFGRTRRVNLLARTSVDSPPQPVHIFSVDVEEYFQVSAFDGVVTRDRWPAYPSRLASSIDLILDRLACHGATGTFFTLGWIAERHPHVVRRIASAGHELASHGWWHRRIPTQSPSQFREEARCSKDLLEQLSGEPVFGFRAPSFSIVPGCEWALDVLIDEGYRYDSSMFPIRRPGYGYPRANPYVHTITRAGGTLYELPPATTTWLGRRVPAAGGGYLRHFPLALIQRAFREHTRAGRSGVFYVHPWELDPGQPRLSVGPLARVRHYAGLTKTLPRVESLLAEFRFTSAARHLGLASSIESGSLT